MTFKIGDRVITRGLGVGTITRIGDDGSYHMALDKGGTWSAKSVADLVPVREVARPAGEETGLEWRLAALETRHRGLADAMASELRGLELRVAELEPDAEPVEKRPVAVADPETMARAWVGLLPSTRERIQQRLAKWQDGTPHSALRAAESALVAVPGLLTDIEAERAALAAALADGQGGTLIELAQRRMSEARAVATKLHDYYQAVSRALGYDGADGPTPEQALIDIETARRISSALQNLAELGVVPGEPHNAPEPDDTAPPPSDAAATIVQLQQRVEELERSVVDHAVAVSNLEHKLAARGDRSPEWVERVERKLYRLAREMGTNGIWDAAVDRAIELRRVICALDKALHLPGCDHPVDKLIDEAHRRLQLYDRLADPEAFDEADPEKLGDVVLGQLRRGTNQLARVRERLNNMMGCPGEEPLATVLAWLEPRIAIMSELELFSPEALNDTGEGLERLGGEESAYIGALLYKIAALQSPPGREPDSEPGPERSRR